MSENNNLPKINEGKESNIDRMLRELKDSIAMYKESELKNVDIILKQKLKIDKLEAEFSLPLIPCKKCSNFIDNQKTCITDFTECELCIFNSAIINKFKLIRG